MHSRSPSGARRRDRRLLLLRTPPTRRSGSPRRSAGRARAVRRRSAGHAVARLEQHDIAGHEVGHGDAARADRRAGRLALRRDHAADRVERLLRLALLDEADDGVDQRPRRRSPRRRRRGRAPRPRPPPPAESRSGGLLNCARKRRMGWGPGAAGSSLGPWAWRRLAASCDDSPPGPVSNLRHTSTAGTACHAASDDLPPRGMAATSADWFIPAGFQFLWRSAWSLTAWLRCGTAGMRLALPTSAISAGRAEQVQHLVPLRDGRPVADPAGGQVAGYHDRFGRAAANELLGERDALARRASPRDHKNSRILRQVCARWPEGCGRPAGPASTANAQAALSGSVSAEAGSSGRSCPRCCSQGTKSQAVIGGPIR